ncbi:MAG: CcmD family protein [Saprospiraceae bacterium]|nr:CcmD family protein [Saprospiraceae bacterium]
MNQKSALLCILFMTLSSPWLRAADTGEDFFQAIGKMYVVVAVILLIFIGLAWYLFTLDRKISRLEKKQKYE